MEEAGLLRLREHVGKVDDQPLNWRHKAVPPSLFTTTTRDLRSRPVSADVLGTPVMTLDRRAMAENLASMLAWCDAAGLDLAPHGKTTMAPALWLAQLEAGCWGITVATEPQLRVARAVGVPRVQVANLLLRPDGLRWLAAELAADAGFEVVCWVDSLEAVRLMSAALAGHASRPVDVCVEVGAEGARTGARQVHEAIEVAAAVTTSPSLRLAGVSGYEGAVAHVSGDDALAAVDALLERMAAVHERLRDSYEAPEVLLTAGGSAYFDRVSAVLGPMVDVAGRHGRPTRVVLRSGAFLTHDDGYYQRATPGRRSAGPVLRSAMHVWATVLSRPEPTLALLDAGRRDVPFDQGLPQVQQVRRLTADGTSATAEPLTGTTVVDLDDQHAYVVLDDPDALHVGDIVRLGLSHPCTAFDKWSAIPVLDDVGSSAPRVVDIVRTYF